MKDIHTFEELYKNFRKKSLDEILKFMTEIEAGMTALKLSNDENDEVLGGVYLIKGPEANRLDYILEAYMDGDFGNHKDFEKQIDEGILCNKNLKYQRDTFEKVAKEWMDKYNELKNKYEPDMIST